MEKYNKSKAEPSKQSNKNRNRSRSRSPHERNRDSQHKREERRRKRSSSSSENDDKKPKVPSPPRISMNFSKQSSLAKPAQGIQIKLSSQPKPTTLVQKTTTISKVFNDSDSDPEEMPAECRMRMRNIGKDTPTSSGPNSFGKTKQGFIDSKKIFERKLKQMADEIGD